MNTCTRAGSACRTTLRLSQTVTRHTTASSHSRPSTRAVPHQQLVAKLLHFQRLIPHSTTTAQPGAMAATEQDTPQIAVVARSGCKYCSKAKAYLKDNAIPFTEVDVTDNIQLLGLIREKTGHRTVPQIFINGAFIGGASELLDMAENGTLHPALTSDRRPALPEDLKQQIDSYKAEQAAKAAAKADSSSEDSIPSAVKELFTRLQGIKHEPKSTKRFKYSQAFTGSSLLSWLKDIHQGDQTAAAEAAKQLLQYHLVYPIQDSRSHTPFSLFPVAVPPPPKKDEVEDSSTVYYALMGTDVTPNTEGVALNTHYEWNRPARPAVQVSSHLRSLISNLYDEFLSPDGKGVSYRAIGESPLFQEYVDACAELQKVSLQDLSREELMCFFINLYNAIIVHATVVYGPPTTSLQRVALFTKRATYNVAGYDYSADDMEHGVLRGNKPPASSLGVLLGIPALAQPQFKATDPRAKKVVTPMDHRIHFALVCGAKSCPPIRVYEPDSLEDGLQGAAEAFCSSEVKVDKAAKTVKASMMLKWYGVDFGSNKVKQLTTVLPYLPSSAQTDLKELLDKGKDFKLEFEPYDWGLNSQETKQ